MSVPKGKRSTSKFEVYHHAVKMRTEITKWMLRDFGIKPKERTLPYVAKKAKMTEEDAKALGELFDRCGLGDKILEDFPSWWITDRRIRVDEILARLMTEISLANSIYATSLVELQQRREHQNEAIGSQISQILGIFYPTPIDHLVKVTNRCAYYGRYMDDFYVIHRDREFLRDLQAQILDEAQRLKLFLNERKTGIIPLKRGFTHLKVKYNITPTGGIIKRLTPDSFTRERRRLKAYSKSVGERMTYREVANAYQSWRGNAAQFQSHRSVQKMDRLYNTLFVQE